MIQPRGKSRGSLKAIRYSVLGLAVGLIFGFAVCLWVKPSIIPCIESRRPNYYHTKEALVKRNAEYRRAQSEPKKQILIGVMTAAQYIDNRVKAVWETWAQTINGDVIFFTSEQTQTDGSMPVVALPGVDDTYPPQKKSFMMIKYLHDYGKSKYKFFMRADDDVYIHGRRLSKFLSALNHTDTLFIGQAGTGTAEELGKLSLSPGDNFCMGGPGMIFSYETLRRMVPHISYCLQNLPTTHEDVEIGRCVKMFAGVPCTFNYEMQKLLFHSYAYRTDRNIFPYNLDGPEIDKAITLHPVKSIDTMYELHEEMNVRTRAQIQTDVRLLENEVHSLDRTKPCKSFHHTPKNTEDIIPWLYFNLNSKYSQLMFSIKRNNELQWKWYITQAIHHVILQYNEQALAKGRLLEYKDLIHGYRRTVPNVGQQMVLDLKLEYKRIVGKTIRLDVKKRLVLNNFFSDPVVREITPERKPTIYMILPLSGRLEPFKRFLRQFELVCGDPKNNCRLLVMHYDSPDLENTLTAIQHSSASLRITSNHLSGNFSRAIALHEGLITLPHNALTLFIDVDIHITSEAMGSVHEHTILGKQLYYPIVFSQYDSHMVCGQSFCPPLDHSSDAGSFRYFGFGIASMYKEDYLQTGGFDLSIHGWGKEDVDLFSKTLKTESLHVFRAADPGFTHVYHPVRCDASLNPDQAVMCINSKSASFASQRSLSEIFLMGEKHHGQERAAGNEPKR